MNPPGAAAAIPNHLRSPVPAAVRPFEPERSHPEPPDSFPRELFFDGGIGLLIEQGNTDNARVLLGRRAASHPQDPTVYLDAIRAERTAAPEAQAWQAWLERALRQGVEIGDEARRLLPSAALQAFLVRSELAWKVLQKQPSSRDARELLRLRLEGLLLSEPRRALDELEQAELVAAANDEPALRALCCEVLRACALLHAERVTALLPRYAQADAGDAAKAAVVARLALAPSWSALEQRMPCPKPLTRFVTLAGVLSDASTRALCAALDHDLRAQPREYLRCADDLTVHSPALRDALQSFAHELASTHEAASANDAELTRALTGLERALAQSGMQWVAASAGVLGWPLGHALDRARYRRAVRGLLAALIARDQLTIAQLLARLEREPRGPLRRLARPLRTDSSMALLEAWARAAAHTCSP
jgi:hypothetical protein